MSARPSAEVVNATLLEIFLALTFLVLAVAWAEQVTAEASAKEAHDARGELDSLRAELDRRVRDAQRETAAREAAEQRLNETLFRSQLPPFCEDGGDHPVLELTLRAGAKIDARVRKNFGKFTEGFELELTPTEFRSTFADLERNSIERGCRYRVRVIDQDTSKDDFKQAMTAIRSIFYTVDAFRTK